MIGYAEDFQRQINGLANQIENVRVQDSPRPWYSVLDPAFGAPVDGTSDASPAIQRAVDAAGVTGGIIYFPPGKTYLLNTASILFPKNITKPLVLWGYGATIKLSSSGPGFLKFNRTADHDVFKNIYVQGFTIDANSVDTAANAIIGNYYGGSAGARMNFENIIVRDIRVINLPANGNSRLGIDFTVLQSATGEGTQNYAKNLLFENIRIEGGDAGIYVVGSLTTPGYGANIYFDNIQIKNCWHSTGTAPTAYAGFNSFQIGGYAFGDRWLIRDSYARYAGDCGFEMNATLSGVIDNCTAEDTWNNGFYTRNYNYPSGASGDERHQVIVHRDCRTITKAANINVAPFQPASASGGIPLGQIVYENCAVYKNNGALPSSWIPQGFYLYNCEIDQLVIRGFHVVIEDVTYTTGSDRVVVAMRIQPKGTTHLLVEDVSIRMVMTGSGSGASHLICEAIHVAGDDTGAATDLRFEFANILFDIDITNAASEESGFYFGDYALDASGVFRHIRVKSLGDYSAPRAIQLFSSATLTILDAIHIVDGDFSAVGASGYGFTVGDNTNKALVIADRNILPTFPVAASGITPSGSPYVYRNYDSIPQVVTVQGGTVTKIELSNDGSNYYDAGATAGAFRLDAGYYIKTTYSSAPTMTKIPDK